MTRVELISALEAETARLKDEHDNTSELVSAIERGELQRLREENARLRAQVEGSGPATFPGWLVKQRDEAVAENTRLQGELDQLRSVTVADAVHQRTLTAFNDKCAENTSLLKASEQSQRNINDVRRQRDDMADAVAAERAENTRLYAAVADYVRSQEGYVNGKLYYCSHCDPLDPWNEADTDETGPTREQFTHWPDCKILALKPPASDNSTIRQPGPGLPECTNGECPDWKSSRPHAHAVKP